MVCNLRYKGTKALREVAVKESRKREGARADDTHKNLEGTRSHKLAFLVRDDQSLLRGLRDDLRPNIQGGILPCHVWATNCLGSNCLECYCKPDDARSTSATGDN